MAGPGAIFMHAAMLAVVLAATPASGAVWQWSVDVADVTSPETQGPPRAYLWIPPDCEFVRGVIVGQHNMEEELILEHPRFRAALAEMKIAAVWVSPALDFAFRFDRGAGDRFTAMMNHLAAESGYQELADAPVIPIGHSAAASYPWNFAAWNPERTLAAISVSGQWPKWDDDSMPDWEPSSIDGVPGLVTIGEYEWANDRADEGLRQRAAHPRWPLTMLAEPGAGHFDVSDAKIDFLALYVCKACEHRLPPITSHKTHRARLRTIDPAREGWLVERWRRDRPPRVPPASVTEYAGDARQAFWCFDKELARAVEAIGEKYRDKSVQLLGYAQADVTAVQDPNTHQQVTLQFLPTSDGLTFQLRGTFLDRVPPGRPERWTGFAAGSSLPHAESDSEIRLSRICGPVRQLDDDTFAIDLERAGLQNNRRSREIWLMAEHPGDDRYRRSVQQALLRVPEIHTEGADQPINFPEIADCAADAPPFRLTSTSAARATVRHFVLSGPAEIDGDVLRLTPIPPRSRFPVRVTVVAWQWGRSTLPRLKTTTPVERTFYVNKR